MDTGVSLRKYLTVGCVTMVLTLAVTAVSLTNDSNTEEKNDDGTLTSDEVLSLILVPPSDDHLYIGEVATLQLVADFRSKKKTTGTGVYIVTAEHETNLALSRVIEYAVGDGLYIRNAESINEHSSLFRGPEYGDMKLGVAYYTGASYNLGKVKHLKGATDETHDFTVRIMFEVVCVAAGSLKTGDEMAATAYLNGDDILANATTTLYFEGKTNVADTPSISVVDNVSEIEFLKPLTIGLSMYLPYPSSEVEITVAASQQSGHEGLLVQKIQGRSVGSAFSYSVFPEYLTAVGYETCPLKSTLSLKTGPLINRETLYDGKLANSEVTMNITILLIKPTTDDSYVTVFPMMVVNGEIYELDEEQIRLTVVQQSEDDDDTGSKIEESSKRNVSSGEVSDVLLRLHTRPLTSQTYHINISTAPMDGTDGQALKVKSVMAIEVGKNLACQNDSAELLKSCTTEPAEATIHCYAEVHTLNIGTHNEYGANTLQLRVTVMMLGTAKVGDVYNMMAVITSSSSASLQETKVTFTVDSPPQASFRMSMANRSVKGGYPTFAHVTISTPPGSELVYNVTLEGIQLTVLTVNVIKKGANLLGGIQPPNPRMEKSSSMNNSVYDMAFVRFNVTNTGDNVEQDANDLTLQVVLYEPSWFDNVGAQLTADVNEIGKQYDFFQWEPFPGYENGIEDSTVTSSCSTGVYHADMIAVFELHIITRRDSTSGPLGITVPDSTYFSYEQASVVSRGRNVICVELGPIEELSAKDCETENATCLSVPLLCNRVGLDSGKANSVHYAQDADDANDADYANDIDNADDDDNRLVIQVTIKLGSVDGIIETAFRASVHIINETRDMSTRVKIIPLTDFGTIRVITKITLEVPELFPAIIDPEMIHLQWGVRQNDILLNMALHKEYSRTYKTNGPLLARRFRVLLHRTDACFVNFTETLSDYTPVVYGPAKHAEEYLRYIAFTLNGGTTRCLRHYFPYIWVDLRRSLFQHDSHHPFYVQVAGYGILCNSTKAPQVTTVLFRKDDPGFDGENHHRQCDFVRLSDNTGHANFRDCHYHCDCQGEFECSQFTLLAMFLDTDGIEHTHNDLCYIRVY